tara:strand:- start:18820 stop:19302 length:483 start_codon:yes stop_codon:yes gene_type:complete
MPQNQKTYSFISSGLSSLDEQQLLPQQDALPLGIKTPIEYGETDDGLFKMHKDIGDQMVDNFRNMVLTNHGERMVHYDFGANLRELTFELGSEDIDAVAMERISATSAKYMPFITLKDFTTFTDHLDNKDVAKIGIRVTFDIPLLNAFDKQVQVMLYVAG